MVFVWHPTGSTSSPSGVFPGPRGGEVGVSRALPRWCVLRDQEPAPSGPWSGSAYWTQVSEPVLLRASPVCPCIPGPAKRRLGLKELGSELQSEGTPVANYSDSLFYAWCAGEQISRCKIENGGESGLWCFSKSSGMEGRPSVPEGTKRKNGEIGQGSQRHPAGYSEK